MNLASSKAFKGLAVGSLALAISGVATIPASFAAESTPVASQSSEARTITDKAMAKITQGLPGQFQVAYSKKTNKIWVAGTADRDKHVSTIARIDANSLKIEAVAELPIVKNDKGYQYDAAYGITVDDVDGTVWVTNTTDNSVSVYDQATMQQVWTTAGIAETDPNWIEHPRSVLVDHESGKAFVTGRFFVSAIDLKTKQVEKIQLEGAPDGGTRYISMNILVDGGKLYVPERTGGKIFVIDTKTFKVESSFDTKGNAEGEVRPSDIAIDHSQNEIYVSSQGVKGANSGVSVYDATTYEFKKFIPFGTQALSLDNDEANDLVYVTDFGTGKVGVIDGGAADKLIAEVAMNGGKANDLVVLPNGSVVAVDKQASATATVPYVLDGTTGTVSTSSQVTSKPSKDKQGNEVPAKTSEIQANSILKFKVTATAGDNSEVKQVTPETREFQGYPATATKTKAADTTTPSTEAHRTVDANGSVANIIQGLPGQFQVGYSKKNHKLFVPTVGARGGLASSLARVNADTLQTEAFAELPVKKNDKGQYGYTSAYGVTVDDVDGTVWVTNTTDNSVAVYDQQTLKLIWTNEGVKKDDPNWIEHPRSVLVDHESGKAFVTGRFFVSAIDLKTKQVEKIQLEGAPDGGTRYISMNILVDGGKLYVPERTGGKIFVIDTKTFKVESSFDTKGNAEGEVRPSDIAIDHSQNEIYVSSQGVKGANSGVSVYDATTYEFKKFIPFGTQALSLDNDEANDLVYVTDFGTGKVGVIDGGAADKLIAEVAMNGGKANDLVVLPNGSVVAVDKQASATATVPYVLDGTTGTVSTSSQVTSKPSKDKQGNEVPAKTSEIQANSILKFKVTATAGDNSEVKQVTPETREFQGYPATATKTKAADTTTPSTEAHRTVDANGSVANIIQGLPGQFQVGYSKKNHKLFVPTVGARGGLASSLARVNADTLQTEAFAELPVKKNDKGQYGYTSAYGVTVDDVDGTVWVTNTTDNSVAVYDQQTLKLIWTNEGVKKDDPNWIEHPRSVLVDHESGKAFVTGRYFVSAIDLKTKQVEKIQLEGAPEGGTRYISMNLFLDGGKLYVPERTGGKLFVVDTKTFKVEKTIQTQGEDSTVEVRPSDVAVDHSLNEIYVSSQGVKGVNSGISVYDLTTGEFKKFVKFGTQALALEHDEDRDLVYVTDFGTGKVAVFDGRADEVIGEVEMNGAAANDVTLLKDGSVLVLDKKDRDEKVTLPYVLNGTTGEITTASEYTTLPTKDRQGNDVPASVQQLKANSILKFKVGVKDTDASAAPVGITPTSLDFAGYPTVTGVKAEESKPADPKAEDKKPEDKKAEDKKSEDAKSENKKSDAKSENTAEAKDQTSKDQASQSDSKSDAKTGAQDSKPAPDAVKADKSGSAMKNGGSDNLGGGSSVAKSDAGSSQAGSSRGALANTGANAVMPLVVFASVALIAGAALVVRRRKA